MHSFIFNNFQNFINFNYYKCFRIRIKEHIQQKILIKVYLILNNFYNHKYKIFQVLNSNFHFNFQFNQFF